MMSRKVMLVKLAVLTALIWGFFFAAYYVMLADVIFASGAATLCFIIFTLAGLAIKPLMQAFKDARAERLEEEEDEV